MARIRRAGLAVEVVGAYLRTQWWLRRRGLAFAVEAARRADAGRARADGADADVARLARAVTRVLAPLPAEGRCLARSLALVRLLARRGVSGSLVVGIAARPDFGAHAWVERDGRPLLPPGGERFRRLLEI